MARNRLTWQNVTAPDYRSSMQGHALASRMFQNALGGLSDSLGSFTTQQREAEKQAQLDQQQAAEGAFLRQMAAASGDTAAQAELRRTLANNAQVGNKFLGDQLTAFRNAALTGDTSAEDLNQTRFDNLITQRDQGAKDVVAPLQAEILRQEQLGNRGAVAQLQEQYRAAIAEMSQKDQRKFFEGSMGQRKDVDGLATAALGRSQTNQNMYQSRVNFGDTQLDRAETRAAQALAQSIANATPNTGQRMELVAGIDNPHVARQVQTLLAQGFENEYLGEERPTFDSGPTEFDATIARTERELGRVANQGGMGEHIRNLDALASDTRTPMQVVSELRESAPDFFNKYSDGQIQDALRAVQSESGNNLNFGQAAYLSGSNLSNVGWDVAGLNYDQTQDNNIVNTLQAYLSPQAGNLVERNTRAEQGRQLLTSARDGYQRAVAERRQAEQRNADPRAIAALQEREQQAEMRVTDVLRQVNEGTFGEAPVMEGGELNTPSSLRAQASNRAANARQESATKQQRAAQAREQLPSLQLELEMAQYERRRSPTKENSDRVASLQRQIREFQEALQ